MHNSEEHECGIIYKEAVRVRDGIGIGEGHLSHNMFPPGKVGYMLVKIVRTSWMAERECEEIGRCNGATSEDASDAKRSF